MALNHSETRIVTGTIGNKYDIRHVGEKKSAVIDFSVAVNLSYRDEAGEWQNAEPIWENVTAWGNLAEQVDALRPGDLVTVEGDVKIKPPYRRKDGEMTQGRPYIEAKRIGVALGGFDGAVSLRVPKGEQVGQGGGNSAAPAKKSAPSKPATKPAPKPDLSFEDDGDDLPF